jgi:hypothetical protein
MSLTDLRRFWDSWIGGAALGQVGRFAPPDTSTGDNVYSLPEAPGPYSAFLPQGTPIYSSPTDTSGDALGADKPVTVVGATKGATSTTGRRYVHGNYSGAAVPLGLVDVGRIKR